MTALGDGFIEGGEKSLLEKLQFIFQRGVAIDEKESVGGVIMPFVEIAELFIAQIRDIFWIAARFMGIGGAGHQPAENMMKEKADRIGKGAFHFIVHNALKLQRVHPRSPGGNASLPAQKWSGPAVD